MVKYYRFNELTARQQEQAKVIFNNYKMNDYLYELTGKNRLIGWWKNKKSQVNVEPDVLCRKLILNRKKKEQEVAVV